MDDKESVLSISNCKFSTNGEQYFSIFDKHIPCGLTGNIMLFGIGNPYTADLICSKNPSARYVIVDEESLGSFYRMILNRDYDISILNNANLNEFPNTDMKFDCIIMNPPYQRNLHLKILAEAIKHLKDDNSKVVNLSPTRWLEDPLAGYKENNDYHRFEDSVAKHIESIDILKAKDANKVFNINIFTNLGLYVCGKNDANNLYKEISENALKSKSIFYKINDFAYIKKNNVNSKLSKEIDGIRVIIPSILGQKGGQNNLSFYEFKVPEQIYVDGLYKGKPYEYYCGGIKKAYAKKNNKDIKMPQSIKFNSVEEASNFINSVKNNFITFCLMLTKSDMHPHYGWIPWMGEQINPRTGKKGYQSDWTDEDFCKFFDITDEEFEEITKQIDMLDKAKK